MSPRVVLPGATLAVALTAGALLLLVLALALRSDGPFIFGLGDSEGQARLQPVEAVAPPAAPAPLPAGTTALLLPSGVVVPTVDLPAQRGGALRGAAQPGPGSVRRRGTTPTAPAPAGTPAPTTSRPGPTTTTRPVATPAPNPVAEKERGRGTPAPQPPVKRVAPRSPAPGVATPDAAPVAPVPTVEMRTVQPSQPADAGVGADDGVLKRVPAPRP